MSLTDLHDEGLHRKVKGKNEVVQMSCNTIQWPYNGLSSALMPTA